MNSFQLISIEWTCYNGWIFHILYIESYKPIDLESSLFGFNISKDFFLLYLFWHRFTIYDNTETP